MVVDAEEKGKLDQERTAWGEMSKRGEVDALREANKSKI